MHFTNVHETPCIADHWIKFIFSSLLGLWDRPYGSRLFNPECLRGIPSGSDDLKKEWCQLEAEVFKLRRPRQCIEVYFDNSVVPTTVSKDLTCGDAVEITTKEAETMMSFRYGRETKIYVVVGEAAPQGRILKWGPPGDFNLVRLQEKFKLRCTHNIEDINSVF